MSELAQASLFDGTEYNLAIEQERRQLWLSSGQCKGLTEIGQFTVATTTLSALQQAYSGDYNSLYDHSSSDQASEAWSRYGYDVEAAFVGLVEADLARMDSAGRNNFEIYDDPLLTWGLYREFIDDIHTDTGFGVGGLRYFATIAGPGTLGVVGNLGSDCFTDNFDLKSGVQVPQKDLRMHVAGRVLRFSTDYDPHTPPTCEEPVFRATIQQTVHNVGSPDQSIAGVERVGFAAMA